MVSDHVTRARYGAGLLALIALFGVSRVICRTGPEAPLTLDAQVQAYTERYTGLKDLLPARGVIGYVSERSDSVGREDEAPDERQAYESRWFYLTQYSLAPLIVVRDETRIFIICNTETSQRAMKVCRRPGLDVVRDLGNGLVLLRRIEE